jgi:D-glycero-D-manno-heptose 1,7-bisphosphate phosphatase
MSAISPIELIFSAPRRGARRPAVFLDRDGVINRKVEDGYVTRWDEFHFVPGIEGVLEPLAAMQRLFVVVSNQACVGRGLVDIHALTAITVRFVVELTKRGVRIDGVYYCPHVPSAECGCRKPRPGMFLRAADTWNIDLSGSVVVGDSMADVEAARAAGCRAILFQPDARGEAGQGDALVARSVDEIALRLDEHFNWLRHRV